jgi:hypothetical protein
LSEERSWGQHCRDLCYRDRKQIEKIRRVEMLAGVLIFLGSITAGWGQPSQQWIRTVWSDEEGGQKEYCGAPGLPFFLQMGPVGREWRLDLNTDMQADAFSVEADLFLLNGKRVRSISAVTLVGEKDDSWAIATMEAKSPRGHRDSSGIRVRKVSWTVKAKAVDPMSCLGSLIGAKGVMLSAEPSAAEQPGLDSPENAR